MQMAKKHMKICSISPVITELQITTTMSYHLTLVRITVIKKSMKDKCRREYGEKGTLLHNWWECKFVTATMESLVKKLKIVLPYDTSIPLLGIYPKKTIIQ